MSDVVDPSAPTGPRHSRRYRARHSRLRRWPRRVLITCNVVVVVLIAAACSVAGYAIYEFGQINHVRVGNLVPEGRGSQSTTADDVPAFTVLIIGADTRDLKKPTGLDIGNDQTNSEDLSDSIILARVVPAAKKLALLSIPRDLFVDVPGLGEQKINAAFAGGDPSRLIEVIEHQLGIEINHFVEVNFDSFEQIADEVGGVEQYFPTPARDEESGLHVPQAGCVLLKGARALAFVRSRYYQYKLDGTWNYQEQPESDLGRIQRQQAFIKNAILKAQRNGDLSKISVLTSIVGSVTSNLTVDSGFSDTELLHLAEDFAHVDAATIPNLTYPVENAYGPGGASGLDRVPAADAATVARFLSVGTTQPTKRRPATSTSVTTVPRATVSVAVENGSGQVDQAATVASALESAGYKVTGETDAANYDYSDNVIEYGASGRRAADTLRASLAGGATLQQDPTLTGSALVLITGADYAGVTTSRSPSTTTTTTVPPEGSPYTSATAIVPSSSSTYKGVYIPPGRIPGQKVSTCGN